MVKNVISPLFMMASMLFNRSNDSNVLMSRKYTQEVTNGMFYGKMYGKMAKWRDVLSSTVAKML